MRVIKGTPDPVIVDELSDELALHCGLPIFKIAERIRVELDRLCDQIEKTTGGRLFSYVVPFSTAIACGFKVANNQWANSLLMHIYHTESDYPLYSRSTLCGAVATASGDDDLSSMIDTAFNEPIAMERLFRLAKEAKALVEKHKTEL